MVPPNGVSLARSGSTWIHWKSSVASANASTRSWVTSCQSLTPSSSPILALSSSGPVMVSMPGAYGHRRSRGVSSDDPQALLGLEGELVVPAGRLDLALGAIGGGEQQLGRRPVL